MRLELKGKTNLTIRVLHALAECTHIRCKGAEIADAVGTTLSYLPQVMTPLLQQGWVESATGPSGGYRLLVDLADISLLDVIEAVEGVVVDGRCVVSGDPCPGQGPCALHDPWVRARDSLLSELGSTPVTQVHPRAPLKEGTHGNEDHPTVGSPVLPMADRDPGGRPVSDRRVV